MRIAGLLLLVCCSAPMGANAGPMYRCEIAGVATYSDRPCGTDSQPHELDAAAVSTYSPPVANSHAPAKSPPTPAARRPVKEGNDAAKRAELCDRLTRSLKEVRAKMRAGYKAKEGERLRDRLAKLKSQSTDAKCR